MNVCYVIFVTRMEVPLALLQHHQKEGGQPAGGAQRGRRCRGEEKLWFSYKKFDFKHLEPVLGGVNLPSLVTPPC